ncbi:MAG TPA: acyl carrier protein [Vicinamibacterales bacterium]|nr:acyl carrier protein [Vicinamibacterales bacterium]
MSTSLHTRELRTRLVDVVFASLDELNEQRAPEERLRKALETPLVGDGGSLDSLGLVNLIVILEERLDAVIGAPVTLLDDEHLDPSAGHFATVGTLVAHLETLLSGNGRV